jgi:hypothetical protein
MVKSKSVNGAVGSCVAGEKDKFVVGVVVGERTGIGLSTGIVGLAFTVCSVRDTVKDCEDTVLVAVGD